MLCAEIERPKLGGQVTQAHRRWLLVFAILRLHMTLDPLSCSLCVSCDLEELIIPNDN